MCINCQTVIDNIWWRVLIARSRRLHHWSHPSRSLEDATEATIEAMIISSTDATIEAKIEAVIEATIEAII